MTALSILFQVHWCYRYIYAVYEARRLYNVQPQGNFQLYFMIHPLSEPYSVNLSWQIILFLILTMILLPNSVLFLSQGEL